MTLSLSEQQVAFYTNNGFLELEGLFSPVDCAMYLSSIVDTLQRRQPIMEIPWVRGRDLWRDTPILKTLLCSRKLSSVAFAATGKSMLRLALDQWFEPNYFLQTPQKIKDLFSIQGIYCALFLQFDEVSPHTPHKQSSLGLSPFPEKQGSAILIQPSLLLNWTSFTPNVGLYLAVYALSTCVYVQNTRDPAGRLLRQYGYSYGDCLRNTTHPLLSKH